MTSLLLVIVFIVFVCYLWMRRFIPWLERRRKGLEESSRSEKLAGLSDRIFVYNHDIEGACDLEEEIREDLDKLAKEGVKNYTITPYLNDSVLLLIVSYVKG